MRIGFTGHRPNRLHIGAAHVASRLREVLERIRSDVAPTPPQTAHVAISPLAEGSDRLFAEVALALGYDLYAMLPMPVADYVQTFSDPATTPAFHSLMSQARDVAILQGKLTESKAAYQRLGRVMVDRCELLMCVWDGRPAAGKGGTPDVIAQALQSCRPVIWIDSTTDRPPQILHRLSPHVEAVAFHGITRTERGFDLD